LAQSSQKSAQSGCTELSGGAPDTIRCARLALANWLLSRLRRRRTAINHRTVRWCTRLSGEPTVCRANGRPWNPRATRGRANGQKGAPDCPVCTGKCPVRQRLQSATVGFAKEGKKSAPDSVRWCTRLSGAPDDRRQELPSWNALNGS
jgi:hypothetical protein